MPPGAHAINAWRGDGPVSLAVNVNAEGAANAQKSFELIMEQVGKGEEDRPYIDLNHNDEEAAGWPAGFTWGGDDPQKGGIRMKLEWSAAGKAAILGKNFRRFSPTFYVDENGIVIGAPVNMGGLVNRAAFKRIAPIWSKSASAVEDPAKKQTTEEEPTMKTLLSFLASQGLLKSADVDEGQAVAQVTASLNERATKASATETELTQTKAKLGDTEKKYTDLVKAHATSVVDAAIQAGRLPGQNDELKAKWVGLIQADPTNASLLPEPSAALQQLVKAKTANDAGKDAGAGAEHEFLVKAKEYQAEHKVSEAFAFQKVAAKDPALYDSYRESLLRKS
jgi:phage I-like protein